MNKHVLTIEDFFDALKHNACGERSSQSVLKFLANKEEEDILKLSLHDDLGLDSLDMIEIVVFFERTHQINISDEIELRYLTVKTLIEQCNELSEPCNN